MPSVPRIVTVDSTYNITRIVRGAMSLLDRQYILIEVPSSDDALGEVSHSSIDLVVTAQDVPGDLDGVELATRISHESLGTPVIVLGEAGDAHVDDAVLKDAPYQYFMRPVAEPFLRGLRIALDGEASVEASESQPDTTGLDLGPVPEVDIEQLRDVVVPLVRDVGAMAVILADRTGRVLIEHGATGYIDRETLAVILGPSFARSSEVSDLVGGRAWTMQYYDGERLDVFGLALGLHYFLCLIFDGANRGAFGAVTMFGRRAADQMIGMLGDVAYSVKATEAAAKPKKKKRKTQEAASVVAEAAEEPAADMEALFDIRSSEPTLEPVVDFDADALFGQSVDDAAADDLFDPDALGDLAASLAAEEGGRVGYDEAVDMGILDE